VVTTHTLVRVQHQRWRIVIYSADTDTNVWAEEYNVQRPVTGGRQHRAPSTHPKAFHEELGRMLSRGRQNMCKPGLYYPDNG